MPWPKAPGASPITAIASIVATVTTTSFRSIVASFPVPAWFAETYTAELQMVQDWSNDSRTLRQHRRDDDARLATVDARGLRAAPPSGGKGADAAVPDAPVSGDHPGYSSAQGRAESTARHGGRRLGCSTTLTG